jgi:hypothetical protein
MSAGRDPKPAPKIRRAECYLILEPKHNYAGQLLSLEVDRVVKTRPPKLAARHIAIKLNVDIDERLFDQFTHEATITIRDARDVLTPVVTVEQTPEFDEETEFTEI